MSDIGRDDEQAVSDLLKGAAARVDDYFRGQLTKVAALADAPPSIVEAVQYGLLAGGKRVRPTLVFETCACCGGDRDQAVPAAAAIELIHTFSLVHDDLPAMDDDDFRRGRPTTHKVYGEAMAVLAGDAMMSLAFEVLAAEYEPTQAARLVFALARATGPVGMIGGQVLDIAGEQQSLDLTQLRDVHARKTGALLTAACEMGAAVAGADAEAVEAVKRYGQHLGLAFQIADDALDVTSTREVTGKATGKDAAAGKNTYPGLLGLEESRRLARQEADAAIAAVERLGDAAAPLRLLAEFTVSRDR